MLRDREARCAFFKGCQRRNGRGSLPQRPRPTEKYYFRYNKRLKVRAKLERDETDKRALPDSESEIQVIIFKTFVILVI